jgi:membrane protein DedA with SNARE-associated domain
VSLTNVLLAATLTDLIANFATDFVADLGVLGVFVLMLLDAACIPIPSEVTMLFAGFTVSQGHSNLVAMTAAGVAGNLVGSWLAFAVGRYGRRWVETSRIARRFVSPRHLAAADRWFARYGEASVLVGRLLPLVRTFISLPAGATRMSWQRFTVLTAIGCIPWVFLFAWLGTVLGANWDSLRPGFQYADYAIAAVAVLAVVWLLVRRARRPAGP